MKKIAPALLPGLALLVVVYASAESGPSGTGGTGVDVTAGNVPGNNPANTGLGDAIENVLSGGATTGGTAGGTAGGTTGGGTTGGSGTGQNCNAEGCFTYEWATDLGDDGRVLNIGTSKFGPSGTRVPSRTQTTYFTPHGGGPRIQVGDPFVVTTPLIGGSGNGSTYNANLDEKMPTTMSVKQSDGLFSPGPRVPSAAEFQKKSDGKWERKP